MSVLVYPPGTCCTQVHVVLVPRMQSIIEVCAVRVQFSDLFSIQDRSYIISFLFTLSLSLSLYGTVVVGYYFAVAYFSGCYIINK
jgi:hypothetical protein